MKTISLDLYDGENWLLLTTVNIESDQSQQKFATRVFTVDNIKAKLIFKETEVYGSNNQQL